MSSTKKFDEQRAKGEEGERFVESLFHRVFTPIYCFSQPTDLLDKNQHEICDLLICWDDILIICSIKNWTFDGDHEQYHKDTVDKAISQIQGAERKLLHFPRDTEIENPYYGRHRFPKENFSNIIRLVVNLGEGEEFYPLVGETKRKGFVSVINKDTLEVMLGELDTPKDLLQYLNEREKLLQVSNEHGKRNFILSGREADLLSLYLKNGREFPGQLYDKEFSMISLDVDGSWEGFRRRPEVIARQDANYDSYFIDELVRREIISLPGCEPIVKLLLSFSRIERRAIGNAFVEACRKFSDSATDGNTFRSELPFGEKTIVLLFYASTLSAENRVKLTELALYGTEINSGYNIKEILVIATSEEAEQFHFAYDVDRAPFDSDIENEIREDLKLIGWFKNLESREVRFKEYPAPPPENQSLFGRIKKMLSLIWEKVSLLLSMAVCAVESNIQG